MRQRLTGWTSGLKSALAEGTFSSTLNCAAVGTCLGNTVTLLNQSGSVHVGRSPQASLNASMDRGCAANSLPLAALQRGARWLPLLLLGAAAVALVWVIASAERCDDARAVRLAPPDLCPAAAHRDLHPGYLSSSKRAAHLPGV